MKFYRCLFILFLGFFVFSRATAGEWEKINGKRAEEHYNRAHSYIQNEESAELIFAEMKRAAQLDHREAQYETATMLLEGLVTERKPNEAFHFMLESAKQGHALAQLSILDMYHQGVGVNKDFKKALLWANKIQQNETADRDMKEKSQKIKDIIEPLQKQFEKAHIEYNKRPAGQAVNQNGFAVYSVESNGPSAEAFPLMEEVAERGHPRAIYLTGFMLLKGYGVKKNPYQAYKWMKEAALNNSARAQRTLAVMYLQGTGVRQNKEEAFKWMQRAANNNSYHAQLDVGIMYIEGTGIEKSFYLGHRWIKRSAEQGHILAYIKLAEIYSAGDQVKHNPQKALDWAEKAQKQMREPKKNGKPSLDIQTQKRLELRVERMIEINREILNNHTSSAETTAPPFKTETPPTDPKTDPQTNQRPGCKDAFS